MLSGGGLCTTRLAPAARSACAVSMPFAMAPLRLSLRLQTHRVWLSRLRRCSHMCRKKRSVATQACGVSCRASA